MAAEASVPIAMHFQSLHWVIHLETASIRQADEFHTRDSGKKGIKVPMLKLYEMYGEDRLCGKYDLKTVSPEAEQGSFSV